MKPLNLLPIPAFDDNYLWVLHDGSRALAVDPGDAAPVRAALLKHGLTLEAIFVTHHHADHTGGVESLQKQFGATVYAPTNDRMPFSGKTPFQRLTHGETVKALGCDWRIIDVPGHTRGHIAYFGEPENLSPLLFCGDTLFSGGCGRLFEGTAAQMHQSLTQLAALPGDTQVCCAHEYTLSNLRFARQADPGNEALLRYSVDCEKKRRDNLPTLPSRIDIERQINPFLRVDQSSVIAAVQAYAPHTSSDPVSVLAALREWKNIS